MERNRLERAERNELEARGSRTVSGDGGRALEARENSQGVGGRVFELLERTGGALPGGQKLNSTVKNGIMECLYIEEVLSIEVTRRNSDLAASRLEGRSQVTCSLMVVEIVC